MCDALRQVVDGAEDVADVGHGRDGVRATLALCSAQRVVVQRPAQVRLPAFADAICDALGVSRRGCCVAGVPWRRARLWLPALWESL